MKAHSQRKMRNSISGRGKRGFSSVVGSVFMVLIVSVLASCYFVYTLSQNTAYNAAVGQKNQLDLSVMSENLQCLNTTYTAYNDTNVKVNARIQNIGSTSVQFITAWLCVSNSTPWRGYNFQSLTNVTVQPGSVYSLAINLTVSGLAVSGLNSTDNYSYASWLVTSKGNTVALQTRSQGDNIIVSQTTQGIGSIMMNFENFTYYNVTGNTLKSFPTGASGYSVSVPAKQFIGFRVIVTNLDYKQQRDIILFANSVFFSIFPDLAQQVRGSFWYVVNVDASGTISNTFTPITLAYNVPTSVYFASSIPITSGNTFKGSDPVFAGTAPINLAFIGTLGGAPFGQNIPFVSILIKLS